MAILNVYTKSYCMCTFVNSEIVIDGQNVLIKLVTS